MNEEKIINELKCGEKRAVRALEQLIERYTPYVYAVVKRIIGNKAEDCEEITADVFAAVWENRLKIKEGSFTAYLAAIARNKAFGFLRKNREDLPLEDDIIVIEENDPREEAEKKDLDRAVNNALMSLEKPQRELFVRHYYYGETIKEAAEKMNINLSTAKNWIYRGKEVLRAELENSEEILQEGFYE